MSFGSQFYPEGSLYVGDLHPDVVESTLYETFSQIGAISSIRICRDKFTTRSLGYAYVNFRPGPGEDNSMSIAAKAIATLNGEPLMGKPMRIMLSQRNPELRKSGVGNIIIKNLDPSVENKDLLDTFSTFGNILSCKIATDDEGKSKGHAFVHFETEAAANEAIEKVSGKMLCNRILYVGKFISKLQRAKEAEEKAQVFTSVFVKNIPDNYRDSELKELFVKYGPITSAYAKLDAAGNSKGFGFVNFENPADAKSAVEEINGKDVDGKIIYAGRAQYAEERHATMKKTAVSNSSSDGVNLYVKNLDDTFTDETLRKVFEPYGTVISAKVMIETINGRTINKGFGFVSFADPDEATKAIVNLCGHMVGSKPLYVTIAQSKEYRKAHPTFDPYQSLVASMQNLCNQGYSPAQYSLPRPTMGNTVSSVGPSPRWPQQSQPFQPGGQESVAPRFSHSQTRQKQPFRRQQSPKQQHSRYPLGGGAPNAASTVYPGNNRPYGPPQSQQSHPAYGGRPTSVIPPRNVSTINTVVPEVSAQHIYDKRLRSPLAIDIPKEHTLSSSIGQKPLTASTLAATSPEKQKLLLGEHLFPLVQEQCPEYGRKITGMMLEMDNFDILQMLDDNEYLTSKVDEALTVLKHHVGITSH